MAAIPPAELARYRATARRRAEQRAQMLAAYRERAWGVARHAAALLKADYSVERVVLFGSLARSEAYSAHSDVDLVVWGLPEALLYRVVSQLLDLDPSVPIDLLRGEELPAPLLRSISAEGVEL
jgi:uncharacterized protein